MNKDIYLKAIKALEKGRIIVCPTDTLYGIAADVFNKESVELIYKIKKRPYTIPLPVAVSSIEDAKKISYIDDKKEDFMKHFLPGPLTVILKKKDNIPDIVTSGLDKVAIRIPDNKITIKILKEFGPLAVTSANIHGEKTPFLINDVKMQFTKSDIDLYVDDGRLDGNPSTIVDISKDRPLILRSGSIKESDIMDALVNER